MLFSFVEEKNNTKNPNIPLRSRTPLTPLVKRRRKPRELSGTRAGGSSRS